MGNRKLKRRGISLILALFTVVVLITLSITFLALAHNEARTSRSGYQASASLQACNWALDYLISYMGGSGLPPTGHFQIISPSELRYTLAVNTDGSGLPDGKFHGYPIRVNVPSDPWPGASAAARLVYFTDPAAPTPIPIGDDLEAVITIQFDETPIVANFQVGGQTVGQASRYSVRIISQLYPKGQADLTKAPLASRVLDVRLKEEFPTEYTHLLENWVSWDAQGHVPGIKDPGGAPNPMAYKIAIPGGKTGNNPNYEESGKARVEGHAANPNLDDGWYDASGRLRYDRAVTPGQVDTEPHFDRRVAINKDKNIAYDRTPIDAADEAGIFGGGIDRSQTRRGLPQAGDSSEPFPYLTKRQGNQVNAGYAQYKASLKPGNTPGLPNAVSGYIEIDSTFAGGNTQNVRQGTVVNNPDGTYGMSFSGSPAPTVTEVQDNDDTYAAQYVGTKNKLVVKNAIEVDPRTTSNNPAVHNQGLKTPGIPNVVVTLGLGVNHDEVRVQVEGKYSGDLVDVYNPPIVDARAFRNGIITVKGGNVKVIQSGPFRGDLTVVAGEGTDRLPVDNAGNFASGSTIYNTAARTFMEATDANGNLIHAGEPGPPYTAAQLGLAGEPPGRLFYPPPKDGVEREGNMVIGGDLQYDNQAPTTLLGLVAENFVLLNDKDFMTKLADTSLPVDLEVDAAIMSFDHSLQFDWDNTAGNPNFISKRDFQINTVGEQVNGVWTPPKAVKINGVTYPPGQLAAMYRRLNIQLSGSVISRFADAEGGYLQFPNDSQPSRLFGYTKQGFDYNPYQATVIPPNFPRWSLAKQGVFPRWFVENYTDRGSYSTEGIIN